MMKNCRREILQKIYSTPLDVWPPHLDSLSQKLRRLSPRWQELMEIYDQPPAPVAEFLHSPLYLNLGDRVYPVVEDTLRQIVSGRYQEAAVCWGIGSGKSFLSSLAISYLVHRTLCLRNPQAYYGLAPGSTIAFLNMGASAAQAHRVVFSEIKHRIDGSPWFHRFCGDDLKILAGEIRFPKNLLIVTGNSAETCPLGYNLLGAVLDEAAWLTQTSEGRHDAAEEIYHALQRRIRSRFFDQGLLVLISSPRHVGDFMERKLAEAEDHPALYASRRALWEVKPARLYCGEFFEYEGLQVPVEYRDDFRRHPERALRDLAARPTEAYQAYFTDVEALEACCDLPGPAPLDEHGRWRADFRAPDRLPRFLHVDLGLKHDACGLVMVHCEVGQASRLSDPVAPEPRFLGDRRDAYPTDPEIFADLVCRFVAPEGGEVDFARIRELIADLRRRGFNLAQVSFDGWQSVDSRQILKRQGFRTALVSVDRDLAAYETLKALVTEGRLHLPRHEVLLTELRRLELVRGMKVDHPRGGSKDVADALAAAASEALKASSGGTVGGRIL